MAKWAVHKIKNCDDFLVGPLTGPMACRVYSGKSDAKIISKASEMFELLEDLEGIVETALHNGHHDLIQRIKKILSEIGDENGQ